MISSFSRWVMDHVLTLRQFAGADVVGTGVGAGLTLEDGIGLTLAGALGVGATVGGTVAVAVGGTVAVAVVVGNAVGDTAGDSETTIVGVGLVGRVACRFPEPSTRRKTPRAIKPTSPNASAMIQRRCAANTRFIGLAS